MGTVVGTIRTTSRTPWSKIGKLVEKIMGGELFEGDALHSEPRGQ